MKKRHVWLVLSLAVTGGLWPVSLPAQRAAAAPAKPPTAPRAFNSCKACHSIEPGTIGSGPSLAGIVGRKAGSQTGFGYSAAMRAWGKVWTARELDAFLADPTGTIPGTRMVMPVRNAAQRQAIIAYLETL